MPKQPLQLRSLITAAGTLELSLARVPVSQPAANEVLVRIDAAPINPSDYGLLVGPADMTCAERSQSAEGVVVRAPVPKAALPGLKARLDVSMPVGNEGAGLVVAAGASSEAQQLLGKTVAVLAGAMYAQYRVVAAAQCLVLPADVSAAEGASSFVNPMTALGMTETMRKEGHQALVHTAAASNLGQMLQRICLQDQIALVNIVRKPEQEALLRALGATYVCNMSAPGFLADLTEALAATGATLAFDATGGGPLPGQILTCMEAALSRKSEGFSRYGSSVHKQVYLYGGLDPRPITFERNFGMAWGMGGWLVTPFMQQLGDAALSRLKERIARELKTTFASHYSRTITLAEVLDLEVLAAFGKRATGEKFLMQPSQGLKAAH